MVSTLNLQEKYNKVRQNFCFYLDIQDSSLSRSISRRLQDMGLQEEVFLTPQVTHIVGSRAALVPGGGAARCGRREGRTRADAMLERLPAPALHLPSAQVPPRAIVHLTVQKAISLLDKLYDTFFKAPRKVHIRHFSKHFIKIEFLDKPCKPVFKEFDEWPQISLDTDPPKEKKEKRVSPENQINTFKLNIVGQKMTRKSRPRIKEKEDKEQKGGYCEMCNTEYVDGALHRRSAPHITFVKDQKNFISLDSLINSGTDVSTFLEKTTPVNGERRSLRNLCNGDVESKFRRSNRSQSSDSTVNSSQSPKRNGQLNDDRKHNTRCSKRTSESQISEDKQYYKVVGVSTKLRSSGGFAPKRKGSSPTCNGTKPLVVKFRKVRRSELSVLSDEAEQFMFPKRASSTSSSSSEDEVDDDGDGNESNPKIKTPPQTTPVCDRQRLARPIALKEESSEEDSWSEDHRRQKRRAPAVSKRVRKFSCKTPTVDPPPKPPELEEQPQTQSTTQGTEVSPLREEPVEHCMKWEDGKLKYTPAVECLEFAFESVPHSEPWFETFKRQDQDKVLTRNLPHYFELYSKSPKLPYEVGQLPPLKPNCCPLSDLVKRDDKPGPSRSYGTRGMKKEKIRKRTVALMAADHPRKSPREHASTLAILGSAGLLLRRKHAEDTKSTASEDTFSDTHSIAKIDLPLPSETQEASERLQQFLYEVFEDATEYEVSEDIMEGDTIVTTSTNIPDVSSLVSECENCDIIRNEINRDSVSQPRNKRGKFKKKNKTGWPSKRKVKKDSRNSTEVESKAESLGRSSVEPGDESTCDTLSEDDLTIITDKDENTLMEHELNLVESHSMEDEKTVVEKFDDPEHKSEKMEGDILCHVDNKSKSEKPVHLDFKVVVQDNIAKLKLEKTNDNDCKRSSRSSASEIEEKDKNCKKKRSLALEDWLQPIVRVSRVDASSARRLRSAGRMRTNRYR